MDPTSHFSEEIALFWDFPNFRRFFARFPWTITIKSEFKPPWFDCELHEACKAKERARQKFKTTNSKLDEIKFANARREFKFLNSKKMRENMYNTDDPALITKKFWSHYKFSANSQRIPECM